MDKKEESESIEEKYEDDFIKDEETMTPASTLEVVIHKDSENTPPISGGVSNALRQSHFRRIESDNAIISGNSPMKTTQIVNNMTHLVSEVNGWNKAASKTVSNWYKVFREYGFVYQYVLDTNQKMASRLNLVSTISSSTLGIFSAFKLWMNDEQTFRTSSDIILMMFNFGIAVLTNASKRYLDDARNEKIRVYIEDIDKFIGEISAQVLKMPEYRMNASEFIKKHNDSYTKLITQQPNLTIDEINTGKNLYKKYLKHRPDIC